MSLQTDLAERAALALIAADLRFFRELLLNPRFRPIGPIAIQSLMPFLSAFVVESAAYIQHKAPTAVQARQRHQDLLITSRVRLKLLDDNRQSFAEILASAS